MQDLDCLRKNDSILEIISMKTDTYFPEHQECRKVALWTVAIYVPLAIIVTLVLDNYGYDENYQLLNYFAYASEDIVWKFMMLALCLWFAQLPINDLRPPSNTGRHDDDFR